MLMSQFANKAIVRYAMHTVSTVGIGSIGIRKKKYRVIQTQAH